MHAFTYVDARTVSIQCAKNNVNIDFSFFKFIRILSRRQFFQPINQLFQA